MDPLSYRGADSQGEPRRRSSAEHSQMAEDTVARLRERQASKEARKKEAER